MFRLTFWAGNLNFSLSLRDAKRLPASTTFEIGMRFPTPEPFPSLNKKGADRTDAQHEFVVFLTSFSQLARKSAVQAYDQRDISR